MSCLVSVTQDQNILNSAIQYSTHHGPAMEYTYLASTVDLLFTVLTYMQIEQERIRDKEQKAKKKPQSSLF